ncbi:MAG TPA: DnaJ domain-containing protein [Candidatus Limnocylindria bacterium]
MAVSDPYRVLQVTPDAEQEVVNAAFRALALKYHPDRDASGAAARRMAELNAAYALVRDPVARGQWDAAGRATAGNGNGTTSAYGFSRSSTTASVPPPPRAGNAGTRLAFGRYAGWTLRDLARQDPDYLRWLSRHASGLRYRTEIYQILGRLGGASAA